MVWPGHEGRVDLGPVALQKGKEVWGGGGRGMMSCDRRGGQGFDAWRKGGIWARQKRQRLVWRSRWILDSSILISQWAISCS